MKEEKNVTKNCIEYIEWCYFKFLPFIIIIFAITLILLLTGCMDLSSPTYEEKCEEWCLSDETFFTIGGSYHSGYNMDKCNSYCRPTGKR